MERILTIEAPTDKKSEAQIAFECAVLNEFGAFRLDAGVKARWLEALRSGEYLQGRDVLAKRNREGETSFCCLGVLCNLSPYSWDESYPGSSALSCRGFTQDTPPRVSEWAVGPWTGEYIATAVLSTGKLPFFDREDRQVRLAGCNDAGMPFEQIADLIDHFY